LAENGIPQTVVAIVETLPFSGVVTLLFTLLSFVFLATTLDSAAYVLASVSTKNLRGEEEPARYNRLLWAVILALVAVGLLYVDGLKIVQSSTVVTALPLIPVLFLLFISLARTLNEDFSARVNPKVLSIDDKQK